MSTDNNGQVPGMVSQVIGHIDGLFGELSARLNAVDARLNRLDPPGDAADRLTYTARQRKYLKEHPRATPEDLGTVDGMSAPRYTGHDLTAADYERYRMRPAMAALRAVGREPIAMLSYGPDGRELGSYGDVTDLRQGLQAIRERQADAGQLGVS